MCLMAVNRQHDSSIEELNKELIECKHQISQLIGCFENCQLDFQEDLVKE